MPEDPGTKRRRSVLAAVSAGLAGAAAALPVTTVYAPGPAPALLVSAALAGTVVTAGLRARLPPAAALSLTTVALAGFVVAIGVGLPRPDGPMLAATAEAVRYSGARILTTAVPVPVTLDSVALPVCATWLASAGSALLLAGRRPAWAALPPVVLLAGAVALVGPTRSPAYGYLVGLVAALVVLLAVVEQRAFARMRWLATFGFAAVVAAAGPLVAAGPLAAGGDRQPPDLRAHLDPPYLHPEHVHPLSLLARWAAEPDRELLEVRTDAPAPLRWVVLSEFTGVTWRPAERYQAAGAVLPPPADPAPAAGTAAYEITVAGLDGGWLPVPLGAREVRGLPVAVHAASDTLVAPSGLRPGTRYTVEARPPVDHREERLATAPLPTGEALDLNRLLPPGAPGRLHEIARVAAGSGSPYQQASRLARHLRDGYRFDPEAPGGNGYPSLDRFLDPDTDDGGRGTSEQFATAFAVLARSLGMPSRVAVGFAPGEPAGGDRYLVRTGDARAWAEVYFEGFGWVPFDPTPPVAAPDAPSDAGAGPLFPSADLPPPEPDAEPEPDPDPDPGSGPDGSGDRSGDRASGAPSSRPAADWVPPLAIVVVSLPLVVVALRRRRSRSATRLRRGDPRRALIGGWSEVRDGLRMIGRRPEPALTVAEVARAAVAAAGEPRVAALGSAVNRLAFGGAVPPESDVDAMLAGVRAYRRALRRRSGMLRRLTWWLDPRPLCWRRPG